MKYNVKEMPYNAQEMTYNVKEMGYNVKEMPFELPGKAYKNGETEAKKEEIQYKTI